MKSISKFSLLALATAGLFMEQATDGSGVGVSTGSAGGKPEDVPVPEGMRGQMFHFRKEKVKDAEGNEIADEVYKHPSVKIPLPIPTREEILAIFNDTARTSEQAFVLSLIEDAFYAQARDQINEFRESNPKATVTANVIDYSKLSINALANMPASERGNKLDEEDMKQFVADYVSVMPQASGKDANKIKAQANILEKGLRTVKTDKKVLAVMKDLLTLWAANTQNLEEHQKVYDALNGRIDKWSKAEPKNVLESIM
jgi:hypothetical protein